MKSTLLLGCACALTVAACAKKEPAPTTQDVTSAPLGPGARGRGPGSGAGLGPSGGPGAGPHVACPSSDEPLSDAARGAIERALADEREAEARYTAVTRALGAVMPFRQLERAERRHAWALEQLLAQHRAPVPPAPSAPSAVETKSRREECALGVQAEKENIALYDELMTSDLPADVQCVFSRLRAASRERHLPALERCAGGR